MSAEAMSAVTRADFQGSGRVKLLALMLADATGEGGQGSCRFAETFKRAELNEEEGFMLLNSLSTSGVVKWTQHPEEADRIIFRWNYEHDCFGGAK